MRWQERLFRRFLDGDLPSAVDLPTGLGKTAVMAIWYLALEAGARLPRRLVYVVDRRALVDQATAEAEKIRDRLAPDALRLSTLRGRHVDNRDWLADPAARAIIVGTVDMIGSRLLFNGYGVSPKSRSYQAGLLGADTLVLLDEAHLCAPFESLLETIANDVALHPRPARRAAVPPLRLLSLSATGRAREGAFRLEDDDRGDPVVARRVGATKRLALHDLGEGGRPAQALAERARALAEHGRRIAVFCDSREIAAEIATALSKEWPDRVALLVGARRVREREALAGQLAALGFLAGTGPAAGAPAFLVATAAGEVGIDIDADHMVCDLVPAERMIQRLGRVNRRGDAAAAQVDVVAVPPGAKADPARTARLAACRDALAVLPPGDDGRHDASPDAIRAWRAAHAALVAAATTPAPLRPALTRALADAWAMTSLPDPAEHAGRPGIEPWLRGWDDGDEPQTRVVWRALLPLEDGGEALPDRDVAAFFEAAPPQASELLETDTWAVVDWLTRLRLDAGQPVVGFLLSPAGDVRRVLTPGDLARGNGDKLERWLAGMTVVVDARVGGLAETGLLDWRHADPPMTIDTATAGWLPSPAGDQPAVRFRVYRFDGEPERQEGWYERSRFATSEMADGQPRWLIVDKWRDEATTEHDRSTGRQQELAEHQAWTEREARSLAAALDLPPDLAATLSIAARLHDEGKRQASWQRAAGAPPGGAIYAKTRGRFRHEHLHGYRHEFGSLPLVEADAAFQALPAGLQDLALHLVAAHHGGARPYIATAGCADAPPSALAERATAVALRFARLQQHWGPWGLAWWEALLRAADQRASRLNDEREDG